MAKRAPIAKPEELKYKRDKGFHLSQHLLLNDGYRKLIVQIFSCEQVCHGIIKMGMSFHRYLKPPLGLLLDRCPASITLPILAPTLSLLIASYRHSQQLYSPQQVQPSPSPPRSSSLASHGRTVGKHILTDSQSIFSFPCILTFCNKKQVLYS